MTRTNLDIAPVEAWQQLLFFEELAKPPPLPLRLLLPAPIRTEGRKTEVGDEARCLYDGGYLLKRITHIEEGRFFGFEVAEQALELAGGILLRGGSYQFRALPGGRTAIALETHYESARRPRWLWEPLETAVCHLFHRHLLAAIRSRSAEASTPATRAARAGR